MLHLQIPVETKSHFEEWIAHISLHREPWEQALWTCSGLSASSGCISAQLCASCAKRTLNYKAKNMTGCLSLALCGFICWSWSIFAFTPALLLLPVLEQLWSSAGAAVSCCSQAGICNIPLHSACWQDCSGLGFLPFPGGTGCQQTSTICCV